MQQCTQCTLPISYEQFFCVFICLYETDCISRRKRGPNSEEMWCRSWWRWGVYKGTMCILYKGCCIPGTHWKMFSKMTLCCMLKDIKPDPGQNYCNCGLHLVPRSPLRSWQLWQDFSSWPNITRCSVNQSLCYHSINMVIGRPTLRIISGSWYNQTIDTGTMLDLDDQLWKYPPKMYGSKACIQ